MEISSAIIQYIQQHRKDNVRNLALTASGKFSNNELCFILQQIEGWQKACKKLPSWTVIDGVLYPPGLSMEQCSSEQTGRYKATLVRRLMNIPQDDKSCFGSMVDLTGGFGVDFSFLAPLFQHATYVERQSHLCDVAKHNFALFGLQHVNIVCQDSEEYLEVMSPVSLVFMDPARRDNHGGKTYAIEDCTPDVLMLVSILLKKADYVVLKLSPMLDWHKAVEDLNQKANMGISDRKNTVAEVHIISVSNECKELLIVLTRRAKEYIHVYGVNDCHVFDYSIPSSYAQTDSTYSSHKSIPVLSDMTDIVGYELYEPNASLMKAGCFAELAKRYGVMALSQNTRLFTATNPVDYFPGRVFKIEAVATFNKKELKEKLKGITKANIAVRNFPIKVDDLRKRLKLKDGGYTYIFATTIAEKQHVILICKRKQ